jgi:hypothetical protein
MIRHHVQQETHAALLQGRYHGVELLFRPQSRIQPVRIDYVIAMR